MIRSELCTLLGIQYPVFQGGMAWIADGKLAAAVSQGGGLGIIAAGNAPGEAVREEIRAARSLTDKPIGVNIMLMSPFVDEIAQVVVEEKVDVVTTGAGNPSKYMKAWKEAAGGIADGRGVAAAFMLGACGVQMGTRFLSAVECSIHPTYKERILKATDLCTMVTGKRLGHPVRSLRTQFARNYAKAEYGGTPDEDLEALGSGALRLAVQEGDLEKGCFLSGQIAALVKKEQSAAEIIKEVMEGAEPLLRGAAEWVK